ncbi:hypothetical protein, conserved [Eimeria praecox]|uniref:Integral membrane bound transporter domain-containing protein n=1 Tax=Eimeria praecox TaxID=51316 RepID=U6GC72_9EIME|nr:hypothetical protein, conserved [Eimeria praecox]
MGDPVRSRSHNEATQQDMHDEKRLVRRVTSNRVMMNVMGRTERALRMALGGALIMALTMCDIPHMDYSFKYVGPFLFFVVGTLAPPMLSSAVIVLFAGLACILLACALATTLASSLLIGSGGKAICIVLYTVFVIWSSFLTTTKTKDMTLIGSYILLYAVPLATLIASPYASGGISVVLTPERFAALKEFVANSSIDDILSAVSSFLLVSHDKAVEFVSVLTKPSAVKLLVLVARVLHIKLPSIPAGAQLAPQQALGLYLTILGSFPDGKRLSFEKKVPRGVGLDLPQEWMYDVPFFVEGVSGQDITVGARPGTWFIRAIWIASGPVGILRNLIIFAFLGFAVYLLVMLVPPIRRQRDVAVREMANACSVIRKSLLLAKEKLAATDTAKEEALRAVEGVEEGQKHQHDVEGGREEVSEGGADTLDGGAIGALDEAILSLLEIQKATLLSGMEPFVLYPGPGVWTMKELDEVRKRLIQCCIQTQNVLQLMFRPQRKNANGSLNSNPALAFAGRNLLEKCIRMYELCEELLTTFPCLFSASQSKQKSDELMKQMSILEGEMRLLALEVFRPSEASTEAALAQLEADCSADSGAAGENPGEGSRSVNRRKSFARAMELLPVSLGVTAFVQAGYSEPLWLSRAVCELSKAQQVNTWHGLIMSIVFPLVPVVVHAQRLIVAPVSALAFWRQHWRGPRAWWRDPEAWYVIKLVIPLIIIFSCGICFPEFLQYSWGVKVTENPIFLDFSIQGVSTRMVPWLLLGYLTVLQTTYNGTVHRGLARTVGILLGSFGGWLGMTLFGSNLAALIAFCSVTVFIDIFAFADPRHPLDGFCRRWGYSGMVFTYTQSLIVTLATGKLGGLTGDQDYLATTRILSNVMGILLAVIVAHLPPLASATTCACNDYSEVMQGCTREASHLVQTFLAICESPKEEQGTTPAANTAESSLLQSEHKEVATATKTLEEDVKEKLGAASILMREGSYVPLLFPWKIPQALAKVKVAATSMLLEAQETAQLVKGMLEDYEGTAAPAAATVPETQELELLPMADSDTQGAGNKDKQPAARSWSVSLMRHGNCMALRELFQATKGIELKEALLATVDSLYTLAVTASAELCSSMPAFGDKLMCCQRRYARQGDSPEAREQAYDDCSLAVDISAQRVIVALLECLGKQHTEHRLSSAARTASAFVIMKMLYHLQSIKFSLDEVHAAAVEGSKGASWERNSFSLPLRRRK